MHTTAVGPIEDRNTWLVRWNCRVFDVDALAKGFYTPHVHYVLDVIEWQYKMSRLNLDAPMALPGSICSHLLLTFTSASFKCFTLIVGI